MFSRPACSACAFVRSQLGALTPCPWHAGPAQAAEHEPDAGIVLPTADQPWPFTPRQFARLLLLRSRIRCARDADLTTS
jgi:hypothetical protein